jgi:hypothetical protein
MSVTRMGELRESQLREKVEKAHAAGTFMMDMWYEAVSEERYLSRERSSRLIERIMLDHCFSLQDFSRRSTPVIHFE